MTTRLYLCLFVFKHINCPKGCDWWCSLYKRVCTCWRRRPNNQHGDGLWPVCPQRGYKATPLYRPLFTLWPFDIHPLTAISCLSTVLNNGNCEPGWSSDMWYRCWKTTFYFLSDQREKVKFINICTSCENSVKKTDRLLCYRFTF